TLMVESRTKAEALVSLLVNLQQHFMGRGGINTGLSDPHSPLDPSNQHSPQPVHTSSARPTAPSSGIKILKETPHMDTWPIMVLGMPLPPDVGVIPVISPDGRVDWVVACAD